MTLLSILRQLKGMSQQGLADAMGVDSSFVSRLERGTFDLRGLAFRTVDALERAFSGVGAGELLSTVAVKRSDCGDCGGFTLSLSMQPVSHEKIEQQR